MWGWEGCPIFVAFCKECGMKRLSVFLFILWVCLLQACRIGANPLPPSWPVYIEVRHHYGHSHLVYFWLTDLYAKEERKVKSEFVRDGVEVLNFDLYHPLYDELIVGSNSRVPFYAEPGDSLVIQLGRNGQVETYGRKDGKPMKYENLLRHDISNRQFYTHEDFAVSKERHNFPEFVADVTQKMNVALDSVSRVADRYGFSPEEQNLARCNVQMQFVLWIFEYAPSKSYELLAYAQQHETGWQSIPQQDAEMEAIRDVRNYGFMRDLPVEDSTVFASRYFPAFIQSYEHTEVLNYDQYLYVCTATDDPADRDSAYIAKDLAMTQLPHPSVFMDVAMKRKYATPVAKTDAGIPEDGSILLQEVEVRAAPGLEQFYRVFGVPKEYNPEEVVRTAWAHDVNLKGPISSILNRKKIKNYKRAKKLVEKLGADDAVREALMKAYEETMKK